MDHFFSNYLDDDGGRFPVKTKLVCTVGPATHSTEALSALIDAGMNVVYMNFARNSQEFHMKTLENLRTCLRQRAEQHLSIDTRLAPPSVAIMLDLRGPDIRSGKLPGGSITLHKGDILTLVMRPATDTDHDLSSSLSCHEKHGYTTTLTRAPAPDQIQIGSQILVADGAISLTIRNILDSSIVTQVETDTCILRDSENVYFPGIHLDGPVLCEADLADIAFGIEWDVDFIASSVHRASDVLEIRKALGDDNINSQRSPIKIISKIDSQEALDNFKEILEISDGIMVARGKLGVATPLESIFLAQKYVILECNRAGKPVITATQMLDSMVIYPRPTRAEVSDVSNAVLDGSDAIMLSNETAYGAYPLAALKTMKHISQAAEHHFDHRGWHDMLAKHSTLLGGLSVTESVASSAVRASWSVRSPLILVLSETGRTARALAKYRPTAPILAVTEDSRTARQLQCVHGVHPLIIQYEDPMLRMHAAMRYAMDQTWLRQGDPVILVSGVLEQLIAGSTNTLKILSCPSRETISILMGSSESSRQDDVVPGLGHAQEPAIIITI
jgi:pyruvate kinase